MSQLKDNPSEHRYELEVEGHLAVAEYRRYANELMITHVEVPPELRNRGIAAQVMEGVVQDAKAKGLSIVPVCSYAASYLKRHSS